MGLFTRNDVQEYKELESFSFFLDSLLSKDDYISRKEYLSEATKLSETFGKLILMDKENVLAAWCKQNKADFKKLKFLMDKFTKTESLVKKHNDE